MNSKISRRKILKSVLLAGIGASVWHQQLWSALLDERVLATFTHGVASGEPRSDSLLLWTRVSNVLGDNVTVEWELAADALFETIIKKGLVETSSEKDHTVKVQVDQLQPNIRYYYRFNANGVYSEPGRTKTLAASKLDRACIAVVSCSNYPYGYFNAYDAISKDDDIDLVVHLGDYIYEYGADGWGGESGRVLNRNHEPRHEILSLLDYRQRHAQYKADLDSRRMHAAHPLIPIWDDHESANNPYMEGAQNHTQDEGDWLARRDASLQAYFEWMPVAEPEKGLSRAQMWRSFELGDLATIVTLETRHTGRSKQINYADYLPSIRTKQDLARFNHDILWDKSRHMLSSEMEHFFSEAIKASVAAKQPWRIVANQIPMARTHVPNIDEFASAFPISDEDPLASERAQFEMLGRMNLPLYTDTWDGYPVARESFYRLNQDLGVQDLLVITGDSHSFWASQLSDQEGKQMGVEVATAGVTSPGDFEAFGEDISNTVDQLLASHNKEVLWTDNQHRGYVKLILGRESAIAEYKTVSTVKNRDYRLRDLKTYQIVKRDGTLEFLS